MGSSKFIHQEIHMYYSVSVDCNSMTAHLTRRTVNGFKNCCISNVVDWTDEGVLWNVRGECEEDEGTDCVHTDSDTER